MTTRTRDRSRAPASDDQSRHDRRVAPRSLREYAFIGDGERGALVGPLGEVAWLCFPQWSDPALFAGVLGSGGIYRIDLGEDGVPGGYYEEGTLIWRGRWVTRSGTIETRDAFAYPATAERGILLRRVEAISAPARVVVELAPACDYGRHDFGAWKRDGEIWRARQGELSLALHGAKDAHVVRGSDSTRLLLELVLDRGDRHDLALEMCAGVEHDDALDIGRCWQSTERAWRDVVPGCHGIVASQDVRRGYAVLRAMTNSNGATIAAATTSLPEHDGDDRNYDYRFCWIRDTCYLGHAGAALAGGEAMLDDAVRFVTDRLFADGPALLPAYLGDGRAIPDISPLDVPGYPGAHNVIGNQVRQQFQLDAFGECLLLLADAAGLGRVEADHYRAAEIALDAIAGRFHEPESGIWETEPRWWSHSRLIAVAGLRAIAAAKDAPARLVPRSLMLADHLMGELSRKSLHASGRWQRAPGDERVDAALLLSEIRGACTSEDPRSRLTREAVRDQLIEDDYVYRYQHLDKQLGEGEGAMLICNFWLSLAMERAGSHTLSTRYFERARSACGSPGLFSEEYDVAAHQLRGNLPQAFVHASLIEAAVAQGAIDGRHDTTH